MQSKRKLRYQSSTSRALFSSNLAAFQGARFLEIFETAQ